MDFSGTITIEVDAGDAMILATMLESTDLERAAAQLFMKSDREPGFAIMHEVQSNVVNFIDQEIERRKAATEERFFQNLSEDEREVLAAERAWEMHVAHLNAGQKNGGAQCEWFECQIEAVKAAESMKQAHQEQL